MGLNRFFKTIEKKYAFGIYGLLISIISLGLGYYWATQEEKPEIIYEVLSNTEVFSINENVNKLQIIYKGEDLKSKNKKLVLLTVKISNIGDVNIKETDYYSKSKFGFKLENASIAESPTIIETSSDFLRNYLNIKADSLNNVEISKVPFDKNEWFTIKLLAIVQGENIPNIVPFGKVSGSNTKFEVRNSYSLTSKPNITMSISDRIFKIVGIIFTVILTLLSLIIFFQSKKTYGPIERDMREYIVRDIKRKYDDYENELIFLLLDIYKEHGKSLFVWVCRSYLEKFNFWGRLSNEDLKLYIQENYGFEDITFLKELKSIVQTKNLIELREDGVKIANRLENRLLGIVVAVSDQEEEIRR